MIVQEIDLFKIFFLCRDVWGIVTIFILCADYAY